jgi:hypothetical protein
VLIRALRAASVLVIGWIVANAGRDSWDVWLEVHTGEGRLRRQKT